MPRFNQFRIAGFICTMLTSSLAAFPTPVGTSFSYQGVIKSGGTPLTGTADFQFTLWDAGSGSSQVGSTVAVNNVSVSDGAVNASLDFGALAFDGNDRWLEIAVRSPAGSGAFTTLAPRQKLAAVPYAQQTRGMFVDASNRIGIGTTTPSAPLHIASDLFPVINIQDTGSPATQAGYVSYRDGTNVETAWVGYGTAGSPHFSMVNARSGGDIRLQCFGAGGSIRLYPGSAGEVQIGTGPTDYLHLRMGGGTSSGFLFGSFPALGDGIHLGYNHYYDAAGVGHSINASNHGLSRLSLGYNTIEMKASTDLLGQPDSVVHIEGGGLGGVWINATSNPGYRFYVNNAPSGFNKVFGNGTIIDLLKQGTVQGSISVSGTTVSYNGFTGSHFGWIENGQPIERGSLVKMTGDNRRLHDNAGSDVIYGIEPTAMANDPACLGAYLDVLEPSKPVNADNPHLVMAVGNGDLWVADSGTGDIEPGDWLISADIPGCAMKDDPRRFPIGHIVARAAERVIWSQQVGDPSGVKRRKVSVFFENFTRSGDVESMTKEIADLRSRLSALGDLDTRLARLERQGVAQPSALLAANHTKQEDQR